MDVKPHVSFPVFVKIQVARCTSGTSRGPAPENFCSCIFGGQEPTVGDAHSCPGGHHWQEPSAEPGEVKVQETVKQKPDVLLLVVVVFFFVVVFFGGVLISAIIPWKILSFMGELSHSTAGHGACTRASC